MPGSMTHKPEYDGTRTDVRMARSHKARSARVRDRKTGIVIDRDSILHVISDQINAEVYRCILARSCIIVCKAPPIFHIKVTRRTREIIHGRNDAKKFRNHISRVAQEQDSNFLIGPQHLRRKRLQLPNEKSDKCKKIPGEISVKRKVIPI